MAGALLAATMALAAAPAQAALLDYTFTGVAGANSSLDLGGGPVDLAGMTFTVTGSTWDDFDYSLVGDGFGWFLSTSVFDFGGGLTFTTDPAASAYLQGCDTTSDITCVGLTDTGPSILLDGLVVNFAPPVVGNPDAGIPTGTLVPGPGSGVFADVQYPVWTQTNSAGQVLALTPIILTDVANGDYFGHSVPGGTTITSASVTATPLPVPEPGSLVLVGMGLLVLAAFRRREAGLTGRPHAASTLAD